METTDYITIVLSDDQKKMCESLRNQSPTCDCDGTHCRKNILAIGFIGVLLDRSYFIHTKKHLISLPIFSGLATSQMLLNTTITDDKSHLKKL